jgi:hypothetical protein
MVEREVLFDRLATMKVDDAVRALVTTRINAGFAR